MKIVYIHQHFATPEGTAGTRSYDVSRYLVGMGHEVTMICGQHNQNGLESVPPGETVRRFEVDGIKVVLCRVPYGNKLGIAARMRSFLQFAGLATAVCAKERGVDLVFATSTPLTVGIPGRLGARLKHCPYVFEVRDLWPEDLVASGNMPAWAAWPWTLLEVFSYSAAAHILTVSEAFSRRLIERGYDPDRVQTILLGADSNAFEDIRPDEEFSRRLGLQGKTVAVYAGAHGDENGLFQILDAAELLRHRDDIAVVLLGRGSKKASLEEDRQRRGLDNVHLVDPVPKKDLSRILAACDIGLMVLRQLSRPRWSTPNKLFDYMFAGLPILVNFAGVTAELVESDGIGVATEPGSAAAMAQQIEYWADHPAECKAMGAAARRVGFEKYDRKQIAEQLAELFESLVPPR